jgi:hypothetical protein
VGRARPDLARAFLGGVVLTGREREANTDDRREGENGHERLMLRASRRAGARRLDDDVDRADDHFADGFAGSA